MTTDQHNELLTELRAIRAALETNPRAVATAPSASSPTVLPLPEKIIQNAREIIGQGPGGFTRLAKALKSGKVALPAVVLGILTGTASLGKEASQNAQ